MRVIVGAVGASLLSAILVVAFTFDAPAKLPTVALGSEQLLFVEQVAGFFVAGLLLIVVVAHAIEGRLPIELRGVKWQEVREAKVESEATIAALRESVEDLRAGYGERIKILEEVSKPSARR